MYLDQLCQILEYCDQNCANTSHLFPHTRRYITHYRHLYMTRFHTHPPPHPTQWCMRYYWTNFCCTHYPNVKFALKLCITISCLAASCACAEDDIVSIHFYPIWVFWGVSTMHQVLYDQLLLYDVSYAAIWNEAWYWCILPCCQRADTAHEWFVTYIHPPLVHHSCVTHTTYTWTNFCCVESPEVGFAVELPLDVQCHGAKVQIWHMKRSSLTYIPLGAPWWGAKHGTCD